MARNVQVASLTVDIVKPDPAMLNLDLQDKVMTALESAGLEVHSSEVSFVRERRMPDKKEREENGTTQAQA